MARPIIALAGASGDLGGRIARALVTRGADTAALIRSGTPPAERSKLEAMGVRLAEADPRDAGSIASAVDGAACVVSALNGVREVMISRQGLLLEGAVRAGVPRFIPSDYSADFTRTRPGDNRNFDLRRAISRIASPGRRQWSRDASASRSIEAWIAVTCSSSVTSDDASAASISTASPTGVPAAPRRNPAGGGKA